jgi:biopolymer transport protein ExbB
MNNYIEAIQEFLSTGGSVLWVILFTTMLLWVLIIDRILYFKFFVPSLKKSLLSDWMIRSDKTSWFALRIREAMVSIAGQKLDKNISTIKTLVALCPLLGLLGTVTGMIAVFDVMALTGTGNARLMAGGISQATIPTMAGMVAALSGLYFGTLLENKARKFKEEIQEDLLGDKANT